MDSNISPSTSRLSPIYDLIIIGGGPAGCSAAVYAARKQLRTLLILSEWGGQSTVSDDVQNWIGTPHISGANLANSLKNHVMEYKGENLEIQENEVINISKNENSFIVETKSGKKESGKTILVSTGSSRRKLEIPGAEEFENKGITYCASCDGPLFSGADVVVIGGGNAGFESASQLLAYCSSVTLLSRSTPRADEITVNKLKSNPKFKLLENVTPKEIKGDKFVNSIIIEKDGKVEELKVSGIFVEIGQIPKTDFAKDVLERNSFNQIIVDPRNQRTKTLGIWSAGDCTDGLYHQNNIASGDAVKALEDIYLYLHA